MSKIYNKGHENQIPLFEETEDTNIDIELEVLPRGRRRNYGVFDTNEDHNDILNWEIDAKIVQNDRKAIDYLLKQIELNSRKGG